MGINIDRSRRIDCNEATATAAIAERTKRKINKVLPCSCRVNLNRYLLNEIFILRIASCGLLQTVLLPCLSLDGLSMMY